MAKEPNLPHCMSVVYHTPNVRFKLADFFMYFECELINWQYLSILLKQFLPILCEISFS